MNQSEGIRVRKIRSITFRGMPPSRAKSQEFVELRINRLGKHIGISTMGKTERWRAQPDSAYLHPAKDTDTPFPVVRAE